MTSLSYVLCSEWRTWEKGRISSNFFKAIHMGVGKALRSVVRVNAAVSAPSPPPVQGSSRGELPAIGWEQGREAKEENPPLNLGSDEWVAVQDFSLLDGWGDADAKKGNAFSHCIFTSKMPWKAAHPGLHLLMRQIKVTGGWRSSSCTILQCHAASRCPVPPVFHAFGLADSKFSYTLFVLLVICFCIRTHQLWQPSERFFFQSCNLNMLGCIFRLSRPSQRTGKPQQVMLTISGREPCKELLLG